MITTGGTGVTGRDVTPEAIEQVAREAYPGLRRAVPDDQLREDRHVGAAVAGDRRGRGRYLPVRPARLARACRDGWDEILVHQLDSRYRPCNFAELLPRLRER